MFVEVFVENGCFICREKRAESQRRVRSVSLFRGLIPVQLRVPTLYS